MVQIMEPRGVLAKFGKMEVWAARVQYLYALFTWPGLTAMLAAISGYLSGIPVMWVVMASAITFAAMAHGMLRFNEWRARTAIEYKFDVMGLFHRQDCTWNKAGKPTKVEKINIGIQLMNRASFPIQYRFDAFRVIIEGRVANAETMLNKVLTIPASVGGLSHPDAVDVSDLKTLDLKGRVEIEVSYGVGNDLKYHLSRKYKFEYAINPKISTKPIPQVGFAPNEIT